VSGAVRKRQQRHGAALAFATVMWDYIDRGMPIGKE